MARDFAKPFYNSKAWQKCRAAYIAERKAIDGGLCETCHDRPGYIVHHRIELSPENIDNPDITLNHRNLKYDCQRCHNKENPKDDVPGLVEYDFDDNGEMVIKEPARL